MSSHLVIIVPSTLLLILSAPVSPGWLKNSDQRSVNCLFISGILRRNDFLHPPRFFLGGIERQYQSRNWYKNKAKNACIRKNINNNTLYRNFFIIFHKDDLEIKLKS